MCFQSQMKLLENQRVLLLTLSIKPQKKTSLSAVIDRLATQQKKCIIIIIIIFIIITIVVITDLLLQVWIKLNLKCRMNDCFELPAHRRPCLKKKKCA